MKDRLSRIREDAWVRNNEGAGYLVSERDIAFFRSTPRWIKGDE